MASWLKAGLIGAGILVVLALVSIIPFAGLCVVPLRWIAYIVIGIMAASYMTPPREAGKAAGQGALAGMVAAAVGGIVSMVISVIQVSIFGGAQQMTDIVRQIPPEVMQQLRDAGIPVRELLSSGTPAGVGLGSAALCSSVCCMGGIAFAAALAALGAAIYAGMKSE